jgi:hypothetical protein
VVIESSSLNIEPVGAVIFATNWTRTNDPRVIMGNCTALLDLGDDGT